MEGEHKEPMFKEITADDPDQQPTEIESYCVNCGQNGVTKLLLTKIPHYKEVILMSFSCEHCGLQNNEIQSGAKIQEKGIKFTVEIQNDRDLSRQVVKSDYATISVPELELEIPPTEKKGEITTVEGVLRRVITGLLQDQVVRRALHPEDADKIDEYIKKIEEYISLKHTFKVILTDPSGDSFIENLHAPRPDPLRVMEYFERTSDEDHLVGIYTEEDLRDTTNDASKGREATIPEEEDGEKDVENFQNEILSFRTNCPECNAPAETNMKVTCIPHFKEVVIMATVCDYCGHKTNEVKSGGGMEDKGKKIVLKVTDSSDLSRDVLKSETCSLTIPELELEMGCHALSGRFTTLEGLLRNVFEQIVQNPIHGGRLLIGDSADADSRMRFEEFTNDLNNMIEAKRLPFTIILDDPAGNSYLQNVYAPEDDPEMEVIHYERSWDQNEMLGINDMKVEGYEHEEGIKENVK